MANGEGYTFVCDPTAGIPAVLEEITPSGTSYYYREPDGSLVARRQGLTGSNWRYYHFDEIGSTRLLTDADGTVTDSYAYDAWGNVTGHTGTTSQPYQYVGRLGYYAHCQDPDLGLLQLGARFYDREIGRFTQRDPIPSEISSPYAYVENGPTVDMDPQGLFGWWDRTKKCWRCLNAGVLVPLIAVTTKWVQVIVEMPVKRWVCKAGKRTLVTVIVKVPRYVLKTVTVVRWVSAAAAGWAGGTFVGCSATCVFPYHRDFWEHYDCGE